MTQGRVERPALELEDVDEDPRELLPDALAFCEAAEEPDDPASTLLLDPEMAEV